MTERRKLIEFVMVCLVIVGSITGYYLGNNRIRARDHYRVAQAQLHLYAHAGINSGEAMA